MQSDRESMLEAVAENGAQALEEASDELKGDREFMIEAVKQDVGALKYASAALQGDREIVMEAVYTHGWQKTLLGASAELCGDREFMLDAMQEYEYALEFASPELLGDREFMLEAVKIPWTDEDGYVHTPMRYVSAELRSDREAYCEILLEAIKHDRFALSWAPAELRGDREFVMEAVKQNGYALQDASAELKGDREIVMEAASSKASTIASSTLSQGAGK